MIAANSKIKTKRCCRCGEVKALYQYHWSKAEADHSQRACKACNAIYQREYHKRRREEAVG